MLQFFYDSLTDLEWQKYKLGTAVRTVHLGELLLGRKVYKSEKYMSVSPCAINLIFLACCTNMNIEMVRFNVNGIL